MFLNIYLIKQNLIKKRLQGPYPSLPTSRSTSTLRYRWARLAFIRTGILDARLISELEPVE